MTPVLFHHFTCSSQMSDDIRQKLIRTSVEFGVAYDSFLNTEEGREIFIDNTSRGIVTFVRVGKDVEILGGLCAPQDRKLLLLKNFVRFLENRDLALSAFNVPEIDLSIYRRAGFRITKMGEELYLPLPTLNWNGKCFWKFRTKTNKCRKQGLRVLELKGDNYIVARDELSKITKLQLREKAQKNSLNFFVGQCPPKEQCHRRVFCALSATGRIEGFVVLLPYLNQKAYGLDSFRFRPDAPRNVMAYLIRETAEQLKAEGLQEFSLGACPGAGMSAPLPGDKAAIRIAIAFIYDWLGFLYDLRGVFEFKNQFRPNSRNLYVAIYPDQFTFNGVYAFFKTFGMLDINLRVIFRRIYKKFLTHFTKRTRRVRTKSRSTQWRITH